MDSLKEKIKKTELFTPLEKVDLLAGFDLFTLEQRKNLERVIDEFDRKHQTLVSSFKKDTLGDLDRLTKTASSASNDSLYKAAQVMRRGLKEVFPNT